VAGIWREILKLEKVGILDNFFELGGHSLLATQVISRLRSVFQFDISLRHLFEAQTVRDLAATILNDAGDPLRVERTAQLFLDVSKLSEEEVESLLANKQLQVNKNES
jgi:acyl carrier protein